ncbi:ABC transporter ATP-binding protein [Escherichia coli]|uniref:dipeptide ABC transporter ATP-binding protein n=1 Tax=Escherichia coli TaxID=562 RepID=UPI00193BD27C|nr:ABC transporter ATP-binding protein [Escherichia coli]MBM2914940.1 ABC transporter ATP-binding protein [Escherichia coli]
MTALSIMRLIDRGTTLTKGQVIFSGVDLRTLDNRQMENVRGNDIAMVFQDPMTSLNPVLTVGQQIVEVLTRHRSMTTSEAHREAVRLLDRVRIPSSATHMSAYPGALSGGMRQRVMIAIAFACRPRLLIADEPTTALDVTVQAQILDLVRELQREEDMSVLFITHDMGVVAEIADDVMVMRGGKSVEFGVASQVLSRPKSEYTRKLLSLVPRREGGRFVAGTTSLPLATPLPEAILSVRNLVTRFDIRASAFGRVTSRVHAVENVSFDLMRGETLSVVGESGCGKSTMGRSILRLVEPQEGSILLGGQDMRGLSAGDLRRMRRKAQIIFQDPLASLNPRLRIGDAIAEPMIAHGVIDRAFARQRVAELLEQVALPQAMADRYPHEFSGGQRQRICIARALGLEPDLIVADESVSALDVSVKEQILQLLMEIQARHSIALLFISHDIGVVGRISHRIAVMCRGEIVEIGGCAAVLESPAHPYTRKLLSAVPVFASERHRRTHNVPAGETKSSVRSLGYKPQQRTFRKVSDGHFVQDYLEIDQ